MIRAMDVLVYHSKLVKRVGLVVSFHGTLMMVTTDGKHLLIEPLPTKFTKYRNWHFDRLGDQEEGQSTCVFFYNRLHKSFKKMFTEALGTKDSNAAFIYLLTASVIKYPDSFAQAKFTLRDVLHKVHGFTQVGGKNGIES